MALADRRDTQLMNPCAVDRDVLQLASDWAVCLLVVLHRQLRGNYIYHPFNVQNIHILATHFIYDFHMILQSVCSHSGA
jgi:hypothetical protein